MQVNYRRIISCCIVLGFLIVTSRTWGQDIFLKDDFESETLSSIWTTKKLSKNALRHITSPTRTGNGAIEISVSPSAKTEIGGDGQLTERVELREAPHVRLRMGGESWYAFSFLLPSDFPIVETRLVIARWKQSFNEATKDRSPIVSLRYMGGKLRVDVARDRGKRKVYNKKIDLRNRWVDMVFRIIARTNKDGMLQVWKNGHQIVDYHGALGFRNDEDEIYFKLGLYRDHMQIPMRIIYDHFRRGRNFEEVSISKR
ncbi:MAG: polysaccharide lyase [Deltaproteobacteria bacterium]|nr:MAG: polysaccharide lyase [Deltaproteobacteria bacterium]